MRLWSLHPKYLDARGLVALWREALLAQAVLRGLTRGYGAHPQLRRFRQHAKPVSAIATYLAAVHGEASSRGYAFDASKLGRLRTRLKLSVTEGQLRYEWRHLLDKLARRSPALHERWRSLEAPQCHPLFRVVRGPVEGWERASKKKGARL